MSKSQHTQIDCGNTRPTVWGSPIDRPEDHPRVIITFHPPSASFGSDVSAKESERFCRVLEELASIRSHATRDAEIIRRRASGKLLREIGEEFGLSCSRIARIIVGEKLRAFDRENPWKPRRQLRLY